MTQPISKPYIYWADFIRVIAIFLVVLIHVCAGVIYDWGKTPFSNWMITNIYDSWARIAVPLLFMISGFLLLEKNEPLKDFFVKRVARIGIPFIFWSFIYLFWRCRGVDASCSGKDILRLLLFTGTYYHLWFMYALIGMYLATPLLRPIVIYGDSAIAWYFVILWLMFQPGLTILNEIWKLRIGISVPMATGYVGFYILGHLLGRVSFPSWAVISSLIIWVLSSGATTLGTYMLTSQAGKFVDFFYEYLNITVVIASISAFIVLRWLAEAGLMHHTVIGGLVSKIAPMSFGIYLVHALVLDLIGGYFPLVHFNTSLGHPAWSIILVSVIAFIVSCGVVYLLQRIPFFNRLVA